MAKVASQFLVIDTSIAQAAGPEGAGHPTAKHCRDFLLVIFDVCQRVVFTAAIEEEWKEHQSGFARKWRRAMFAQKKGDPLEVPADHAFSDKVEPDANCAKAKDALAQDVELL